MRIVVVSDTHRSFRVLYDIVQKHSDDTDLFIHLGDGERDVQRLQELLPNLPLQTVRGNCDMASFAPETELIVKSGVRMLCTHGHSYGVKTSTAALALAARERNCSLALYGHTHIAAIHYENGLYLMNPGSPSCPDSGKPSYGIIDITPQGVVPFLVEL